METRNCQNCKKDFTIEQDDADFYGKIKVPYPTWCPECRLVRRMVFQNERTLYKRECDLCKEMKIMAFPADAARPVYCSSCWWSDKWDPTKYAQEYDFSRPFFEQWKELSLKVPAMGLNNILSTMANSDYCSICSYLKNCYLCFNSDYDEDCMYSTYLEQSKRCLDMSMSMLCEMCYMSTNLFKCFKVFYSDRCNECINVWFSRDLDGCSDCFGCINLKNKRYYIFNKPYSKEEYFVKLKEWNLESYTSLQELRKKAKEILMLYPRRYMEGLKNLNVTGDYIFNSKNVFLSYEIFATEDSKYCQFLILPGTKDSYDYTMWGLNATRIYECMGAGNNSTDISFTTESWSASSKLQYCKNIFTSSTNLFGCVALKGGNYCILNKQYTKKEYEELIPKIIEHMMIMPYVDMKGREYKYGEFFPLELSDYAYNETVVQKYFPLTKTEAESKGYRWREMDEKNYAITISSTDLDDTISATTDDILKEIIGCEHGGQCNDQCSMAFRIQKEELEFYRANNLPLPRLCPNCRYYSLITSRYPIRYYKRTCDCNHSTRYQNYTEHSHGNAPCQNTFTTTFSIEIPEMVYCEECYQKEVL